MKQTIVALTLMTSILVGCATNGSKPEKGPQGTIAYLVEVESSDSGSRIEVNNEYVGKTPLTLKIFGDKDGTFHNFGKFDYTVTASPVRAGQLLSWFFMVFCRIRLPCSQIDRRLELSFRAAFCVCFGAGGR